MNHLGDFDASTVVYGKFTTYRPTTGATFALGGTPVLSVYKDNSITQSTTGVTLTADFDSVTGLNHYAVDTSLDGTFYSAGSFFDIVITTGTVDSVSVTGTVVGSFTIRKNSALKPTTAARTLDVSATGEAGIDWANIGSPTAAVNLSATNIDVDQIVASVSGAVGSVTGLTAANLDVAVSTRMATYTQPTGFLAATFPGTVASTTNITAGTITTATNVTTVNGLAAGVITAASIAADAITDAKVAADVTIASVTGAVGSVTGAVGSVTGAVGSVTGLTASDVGAIKAKTDNLPAAPAAVGDIPTAAAIADQVWDEVLAGHLTAGTTGNALNAAGAAGDPWTTALPGAYGAGTAGNIVGNRIDAAITSRLAPTVAARTLDVSATGEAGIDWANVGSPTAAVNLSATNIDVDQVIAQVSGSVNSVTNSVGVNAVAADAITAASISLAAYDAISLDVWNTGSVYAWDDGSFGEIVAGLGTSVSNIQSRLPAALIGGNMSSHVAAFSTDVIDSSALATSAANEIADALLNRDMSLVSDTNARTPLNALRGLRNKSSIVADVLTVTKEDDITTAWIAATTPAPGANPISAIDPT